MQHSYSLARCGWLAILRGWAGEPCKIQVSPEKADELKVCHTYIVSVVSVRIASFTVSIMWGDTNVNFYVPHFSSIFQLGNILYSRKISREKTFMNFQKFPPRIWGVASFGMAKASNPRKFSSQKSYFSPIRKSFFPWKFPAIRYFSSTTHGGSRCSLVGQ